MKRRGYSRTDRRANKKFEEGFVIDRAMSGAS